MSIANSSKRGFLYKEAPGGGRWKHRFFILASGTLQYFESEVSLVDSKKPIGVIPVLGASIEKLKTSKYEFGFRLETNSSRKRSSYILGCENEEERDSWVNEIEAEAERQRLRFQANLPAEKKGKLLREYGKEFREQYFVVAEGALLYFSDESMSQPLGAVPIPGASVTLPKKARKQKNCIRLDCPVQGDDKKFILAVPNDEEYESWKNILKNNSEIKIDSEAGSRAVRRATAIRGSNSADPTEGPQVEKLDAIGEDEEDEEEGEEIDAEQENKDKKEAAEDKKDETVVAEDAAARQEEANKEAAEVAKADDEAKAAEEELKKEAEDLAKAEGM